MQFARLLSYVEMTVLGNPIDINKEVEIYVKLHQTTDNLTDLEGQLHDEDQ